MGIKANNSENYEPIMVQLTKDKYPVAFNNKIDELLEQGVFDTREEAEKWLGETPIELELYYEKNHGLFAVESEAIESCSTIVSPYSKEEIEY